METQNIEMYFLIRCDDLRRPLGVHTDTYFGLSDFDTLCKLKDRLDQLGCWYDLLIERFDSTTDSVISNEYIVSNNYLNS